MRGSVNVDALVLLGIHLFYWSLGTVAASGGALDSTPTFQTASASGTSHSKIVAFSATLTDGLAQAVAHESSELSPLLRVLQTAHHLKVITLFSYGHL